MNESIKIKGHVRAYTTAFSKPSAIIVHTEKGDVSVPVKDTGLYPLNQEVTLSINIVANDE